MSSRVYRARRGRPGSAETRDRILHTVRDLLAEGTFHEATVESIAARAGVARSTLNLHFGSRIGLVDAICEHLAEAGDLAEIKAALERPDPEDALRVAIACSVRFWAAEEPLHRSLYGLAEIDPAARAYVERQTTARRSDLRRLTRRLREGGRVRRGLSEADVLAVLLVATSFTTFDELRRNARLAPAAIETAVIRLAEVVLDRSSQ
jgi:AcrR family transcriptional regulator